VYCLVAAGQAPSVAGAPAGLEGAAAPRLVGAGRGRWLVVADAPLARYSADAINARLPDLDWVGARAMEHERVIEHFASRATVVPMKLFTLFSSDALAVADVKRRRDLGRLLGSLEGREEWGLRVSVDPARLRARAGERAAAAPGLSEGTRFLVKRQQEQGAVRAGREDARRRAEEVFAALRPLAADARRREPALVEGATLLLDAAYLVDRARGEDFAAAARAAAGRHADSGLTVVLTGPWPPYNFLAPAPRLRARSRAR
jgi:hypothetical protein